MREDVIDEMYTAFIFRLCAAGHGRPDVTEGYEAGRKWANEVASTDELCNLMKWVMKLPDRPKAQYFTVAKLAEVSCPSGTRCDDCGSPLSSSLERSLEPESPRGETHTKVNEWFLRDFVIGALGAICEPD